MSVLLGHPPAFYIVAMAILSILVTTIYVCHLLIGLLRNWREFRRGR